MVDAHLHVGCEQLAPLATGVGQQQGAEREGEQALRATCAAHGEDLAVEVFVLDLGALLSLEIVVHAKAFERVDVGVHGQSFEG